MHWSPSSLWNFFCETLRGSTIRAECAQFFWVLLVEKTVIAESSILTFFYFLFFLFFIFLSVSHMRMPLQRSTTVAWPFWCHNTLPATAYQLILYNILTDAADVTMHAVHFWGQGRGLHVGRECPPYLWLKKKVCKSEKGPRMLYTKLGHSPNRIKNETIKGDKTTSIFENCHSQNPR